MLEMSININKGNKIKSDFASKLKDPKRPDFWSGTSIKNCYIFDGKPNTRPALFNISLFTKLKSSVYWSQHPSRVCVRAFPKNLLELPNRILPWCPTTTPCQAAIIRWLKRRGSIVYYQNTMKKRIPSVKRVSKDDQQIYQPVYLVTSVVEHQFATGYNLIPPGIWSHRAGEQISGGTWYEPQTKELMMTRHQLLGMWLPLAYASTVRKQLRV